MNRTKLFLNHFPLICLVFKPSDNDNDLSISFHLIPSQPHFKSHRWLRLLFQIYNRDFNARDQFHCQLEFCLSMEFSKLNILTQLRFRSAELAGPGDQNEKAGSLFHGPNTQKPVLGISCWSKTCNRILNGLFPPALVLGWSFMQVCATS